MSDVAEIKERASRVAHHFANYIDGAGFDAKRLAGEDVPGLIAENERLRATIARVREFAGADDLWEATESMGVEGEYAYGFARGEANATAGLREVLTQPATGVS